MPQTASVSDFRTQVYLPKNLFQWVKRQAVHRKVSQAAVIRQAIQEKAEKTQKFSHKRNPPNDLLQYAGIIKHEAPDVSENMDKYLKEMYQQKFP